MDVMEGNKCIECYFYHSGMYYNYCDFFELENYYCPSNCLAFSKNGKLQKHILNKIFQETNGNFGQEYKVCADCKHFIGGGDWNLCCDLHHEGYPYGFLCYENTDACDKFELKEDNNA